MDYIDLNLTIVCHVCCMLRIDSSLHQVEPAANPVLAVTIACWTRQTPQLPRAQLVTTVPLELATAHSSPVRRARTMETQPCPTLPHVNSVPRASIVRALASVLRLATAVKDGSVQVVQPSQDPPRLVSPILYSLKVNFIKITPFLLLLLFFWWDDTLKLFCEGWKNLEFLNI